MNGINPPEDEHGNVVPEPPQPPAMPEPPAPPATPEPPAPSVPPVYPEAGDPFGAGAPVTPSDPFGTQQPPSAGPVTGPSVPPPYSFEPNPYPGGKQKMNWGFFILGFFTPWLIATVTGFLFSALANVAAAFGALLPIMQFAVFVAAIVLWVRGRNTGDNRMRSFGLGMLWSYVAVILMGLLAFGSCLVMGLPN